MPFWAEAFIIGSFVFVLLAIPTVIVTYLNQAVCKNSNNEFKVSRTKNQSSFDRIITASARIGLRLIGLLILLWVAYNVFIEAQPEFIESVFNIDDPITGFISINLVIIGPYIFYKLGKIYSKLTHGHLHYYTQLGNA